MDVCKKVMDEKIKVQSEGKILVLTKWMGIQGAGRYELEVRRYLQAQGNDPNSQRQVEEEWEDKEELTLRKVDTKCPPAEVQTSLRISCFEFLQSRISGLQTNIILEKRKLYLSQNLKMGILTIVPDSPRFYLFHEEMASDRKPLDGLMRQKANCSYCVKGNASLFHFEYFEAIIWHDKTHSNGSNLRSDYCRGATRFSI